jgi:hypothetical protein
VNESLVRAGSPCHVPLATVMGESALGGEEVDRVGAVMFMAPRVTRESDSDQLVTEAATFDAVTAEETNRFNKSAVILSVLPVVESWTQSFVLAGLTVVDSKILEAQLHQRIVLVGAGVPNQLPSVDSMIAPT